jgi:hypothetical protein
MLDLPAGFVLAEIGRRTADVAYWAMSRLISREVANGN